MESTRGYEQDRENRAETITAALLYLITQYTRTGCPRLALCVSRHMRGARGERKRAASLKRDRSKPWDR